MTLSPMSDQSQLHNFPAPPTAFIGRAAEVARIGELLVEPACRLLTLTGSGGVGKTRLALRVAPDVATMFSHGLYFVPLQPLKTPDLLAPAIAEAVGLSLSGPTSPETQVLTYLRDKEVLLLLDNFEQLLVPPAAETAEAGDQSLDLLTAIRSAAARVAGATLPVLSALVDKSLLRWEPDGHYRMHALLRHYAAERLQETPAAVSLTHERHGLYYAGFLHRRLDDVLGRRQQEAAAEIEPALDNIRAAWQWAVARSEVEPIHKAAQTLSLFYQFQGRYLEGARAFEAATHSLESLPPTGFIETTLVLILVDRAWFYIRLGWLEQAETVPDSSMAAWVRDLEAVIEDMGLERFPLLGISQGASVSIAYAVKHPDKVSHLILYGGYARGRFHRNLTNEEMLQAETMINVIRVGWGKEKLNQAGKSVVTGALPK